MNAILRKIEAEQMKTDVPSFAPGDTKERIQVFQGIVLARRGTGIGQAVTVRKISNGEGVERVFQVHSPKVAKIEVVHRGHVRRSKLGYLRNRVGKAATNVPPARRGWKLKVKEERKPKSTRARGSRKRREAAEAARKASANQEADSAPPESSTEETS